MDINLNNFVEYQWAQTPNLIKLHVQIYVEHPFTQILTWKKIVHFNKQINWLLKCQTLEK